MNLSGSVPAFKPTPRLDTSAPAGSPGTALPSLRRPVAPFPLEFVQISHPELPEKLDGFTILHLTDFHIRRGRPLTPFLRDLIRTLPTLPVDLACFTGDAMNYPGDEAAALDATASIFSAIRTRHGVLGVFGNHDSPAFRSAASRIPSVRWLREQVVELPDLPLTCVGPEDPEDFLATLLAAPPGWQGSSRFRIALAHYPTEIYPAAEFGMHMLLAGHTHGGQLRLSPDIAPHTSSDLPGRLASGVLRLGRTISCVPRGLGQAVVDWRFSCPPQAPIYILRRGPWQGPGGANDDCSQLTRLLAW